MLRSDICSKKSDTKFNTILKFLLYYERNTRTLNLFQQTSYSHSRSNRGLPRCIIFLCDNRRQCFCGFYGSSLERSHLPHNRGSDTRLSLFVEPLKQCRVHWDNSGKDRSTCDQKTWKDWAKHEAIVAFKLNISHNLHKQILVVILLLEVKVNWRHGRFCSIISKTRPDPVIFPAARSFFFVISKIPGMRVGLVNKKTDYV